MPAVPFQDKGSRGEKPVDRAGAELAAGDRGFGDPLEDIVDPMAALTFVLVRRHFLHLQQSNGGSSPPPGIERYVDC